MVDFNVRNLWSFALFGREIWITQTILNTWIIMLLLTGLALFLRFKIRKMEEMPRGVQNAVEAAVEASDGFVRSMAGEKAKFVSGWFFTVFVFIFVSNISGLFGLRPPTADWPTNFALAIGTFLLIQIAGLRGRGRKYIKTFFQPIFIFFPLNVISELARPISLSVRLFGNVMAGLVIMTLLYTLIPNFLTLIWPVALHAYFDLAMGILQTYVFCALSLAFIGAAAGQEE